MKYDDRDFWDNDAKRALRSKPPQWYTYYVGKIYRKATEMGLKYTGGNVNKTNLLKTDLWNEGIETGRSILDQYQADSKCNLYGVDISYITCSSAKGKLKTIHVVQGDVRALPFSDSSFDIVLDLSTLDHIPEYQAPSAIQEYKRILKKQGILVLVYWYDSALLRLLFKLRGINYREHWGIQYYFPISLIKDEVKKDFDILEEFCVGSLLNIRKRIPALILRRLPKSIYNLILDIEYSKISKWLLKGFAGLHAVIAKRK